MVARLNILKREKDSLLREYYRASGQEKAKLIIKIMDIENEIDLELENSQRKTS